MKLALQPVASARSRPVARGQPLFQFYVANNVYGPARACQQSSPAMLLSANVCILAQRSKQEWCQAVISHFMRASAPPEHDHTICAHAYTKAVMPRTETSVFHSICNRVGSFHLCDNMMIDRWHREGGSQIRVSSLCLHCLRIVFWRTSDGSGHVAGAARVPVTTARWSWISQRHQLPHAAKPATRWSAPRWAKTDQHGGTQAWRAQA